MLNFLKATIEDRTDILKLAADDLHMSEAIIEKDYWVMVFMHILFEKSQYKSFFAFKGGTSLSKAFQQIQRFSEDIDIILDWRALGYTANEPWHASSKTQRNKLNKEINHYAARWVKNNLLPDIKRHLKKYDINNVQLVIYDDDPHTIHCFYPNIFIDNSILQDIRLEIGPLAAWTPIKDMELTSYLYDIFPTIFELPSLLVPTVEAKRTFWEKATILHRESNRVTSRTPLRYSRHYYDIYMMLNSSVFSDALEDIELLLNVIKFKETFYPDNLSNFNEIKKGNIKLAPNKKQLPILTKDYQEMKNMFFGSFPNFNDLILELITAENKINSSLKKLTISTNNKIHYM